jgi:hypothetical protein
MSHFSFEVFNLKILAYAGVHVIGIFINHETLKIIKQNRYKRERIST